MGKKINEQLEYRVKKENGEEIRIIIDADELNKTVKAAKAGKNESDKMFLRIQADDGTTEDVPVKLSQLRSMLKDIEMDKPLVPKGLSKYLVDMTYYFAKRGTKIKLEGRDHEIEKIWFYLSQKRQNNVFLVGEPDVGKTAICREIIRQISTNECPKEFYDSRVLMLNPEAILKITNNVKLALVIKALTTFMVRNKESIILYIDDALDMLTHENLWVLLETIITKYNIPIITTCLDKNMEEYFLEIDSISKYINIIYVDAPELDEIYPMIKNFIKKKEKEYGIKASEEIVKFGIFTSGLSDSISVNPGNVVNVFEKAFLEAKRKEKEELDKISILSCYDTYLKLYEKLTLNEKRKIAYHEAGHYIANIKSNYRKDAKIAFVSILPMMNFMGVNWFYEQDGQDVIMSKEYFMDDLVTDLAGRVGEMRVTKKFDAGASSDLKHANSMAKAMILQFGFSEKDNNKNRYYDYTDLVLLSEAKKEQIDKEVQELIDEAYRRAEKIISENEELLEIIAEKLLENEILTGEQLEDICKNTAKRIISLRLEDG